MVLSIGMIVKNEEKYLEQCLTALQPILDELDSELIIADTGSTDRTVEIAKKFTDKVLHFDWINDFSAARNVTVNQAKGKWFMFIDADEVVMDCSGLIRFFKSGEYQKYHSAAVVQKSYVSETDDTTVDFSAIRLTQMFEDTKFVNPIHERIAPCYEPTKFLDLVLEHYGYMYSNDVNATELAHQKSRRNLEYLFKQLEELSEEEIENVNYFLYDQIADCYIIINEHDKALEYMEMGLSKLSHSTVGISGYYTNKISTLAYLDRFDEIIETADEYFNSEVNPWHTKDYALDCYVYAMRGYSVYKRGLYNKAINDLENFIILYGKYTKGRLTTEDLLYSKWRVDATIIKMAYDIFFRCCYQEKQFARANEYTMAIPLEMYFGDQSFMVNHLNIRMVMMENVGYNGLDRLYRQLDEFGKDYLLQSVRAKVFETKPEHRAMIIKKLNSLGGMLAEVAEIYRGYFDNNAPDFELIKTFLEKHGSENAEDMLYIMLKNQMDISPFLLTQDFFADRAVQILIHYFSNGIEVYENYSIDRISDDGLVFATSLYGFAMLRAMESDHDVSVLFEKYGALGLKWYNTFNKSAGLPGDIHAALLVNNVVSAKNVGNYTQFMEGIRKLKSIVPDLIPLADAYKEENKAAFKEKRVNTEFEQLAAQVKSNIREMIAAGSIGDARKLIKEFEGIAPNDPDIETLKNEINNSLQ